MYTGAPKVPQSMSELACSVGVFWVSKTLFMLVIVVAAIFDFMTVEDWEE